MYIYRCLGRRKDTTSLFVLQDDRLPYFFNLHGGLFDGVHITKARVASEAKVRTSLPVDKGRLFAIELRWFLGKPRRGCRCYHLHSGNFGFGVSTGKSSIYIKVKWHG